MAGMHPEYKRSRRKIRLVGVAAIGVGVFGLVSPVIPGLALMVVGFSVLSLQSNEPYSRVAVFRSRHPKLSHEVQKVETWVVSFFSLATRVREYQEIPRGDGTTLSTLIEVSPIHTAVAVLLHSASGTKEIPCMNTCAEALRARGYTVIRFDAFNGLGESGGAFTSFTGSGMYADLVTILAWAKTREWWHGELTLMGHSIGGLVAAHYAAEHLGEVSEVMLFAPMVSGDSYLRAYQLSNPADLEQWRTHGERTIVHPLTGHTVSFSYTFVKDACAYNLLGEASRLTMPVHILVGTRDRTTPVSECHLLAETIGSTATMTVIPDISHTPTRRADLKKLYTAVATLPTKRRT